MTYPLFDHLRSAFDRAALGHALLFVTADEAYETPGNPLFDAFERFRALLMCTDRREHEPPCGRCASCRLVLTGDTVSRHPDLVRLDPQERANYAVEDVRALLESFALTRSLGRNRLAWIPQADLLSAGGHSAAANALLKLLEEPRPHSFLVLVTARPDALLPTIRSRCQVFRLPRAGADAAPEIGDDWRGLLDWLRRGAPPGQGPALPADEESFWKERERAVVEVERVFQACWTALRDHWSALDRDAGLRVLQAFQRLEESLAAIRGYGNPPLQWLSFRMDAKLDS